MANKRMLKIKLSLLTGCRKKTRSRTYLTAVQIVLNMKIKSRMILFICKLKNKTKKKIMMIIRMTQKEIIYLI